MTINEQKTALCPDAAELNRYILSHAGQYPQPDGEMVRKIEKHIASCKYCTFRIAEAYRAVHGSGEARPREDIMAQFKKEYLWLTLAVIMFAGSFIFRAYFIQFLVGTVIFAMKWIIDNKNTRMLVMIYEAWKHGGKDEADKILGKFKNRF